MLTWQIAEYFSFIPLLFRMLPANRKQVETVEKIPFGPHPLQYILFYQPKSPAPKAAPLVFFLNGGGWRYGTPQIFSFIGHFFARLGFPTALGGYRLVPAHRFPAQLEDAYAGLQTAIKAASERGIDAKRVLLGGQSAGAQLVSLISYR